MWPVLSPKAVEHAAGKPIETEHFIVGIDAKTGAITRLRNKATGREWASAKNPVGLFTYQTLSNQDFQQLHGWLSDDEGGLGTEGFWQAEIERFGAKSEDWQGDSAEVHVEETVEAHRIVVGLKLKDYEAFESGRAAFPGMCFIELVLPKAEPEIRLTLSWFGKPATRMPEALWLTFNPIAEDQNGWTLEKMRRGNFAVRCCGFREPKHALPAKRV